MIYSCTLHNASLISDITNCITSLLRAALKSQYVFVVGAKPLPANQNVKYKIFDCAFQIFDIFLPVVYNELLISNAINVAMTDLGHPWQIWRNLVTLGTRGDKTPSFQPLRVTIFSSLILRLFCGEIMHAHHIKSLTTCSQLSVECNQLLLSTS